MLTGCANPVHHHPRPHQIDTHWLLNEWIRDGSGVPNMKAARTYSRFVVALALRAWPLRPTIPTPT